MNQKSLTNNRFGVVPIGAEVTDEEIARMLEESKLHYRPERLAPKRKTPYNKTSAFRRKQRERARIYYQEHREEILQKDKERRLQLKAIKDEFARQHPDRMEYLRESNLQRVRDKWTRIKNQRDPEASFMDTYWKIILAVDATHPLLDDGMEKTEIDFDEVLYQLEEIKKAKRKFNNERRKYLRHAWELDLPVQEYIATVRDIDGKKEEEERKEQSLKDFLFANLSPEELQERAEIQQRLAELNKIIPRYEFNAEDEDTHEYIIKEIKKDMAKISFDKGKTFLDILNDRDHNIILSKIGKMKVWNNVVDSFDTDTMLRTLDKMSANERKICTQGNKAENRILYLGKYLLEADTDLIV